MHQPDPNAPDGANASKRRPDVSVTADLGYTLSADALGKSESDLAASSVELFRGFDLRGNSSTSGGLSRLGESSSGSMNSDTGHRIHQGFWGDTDPRLASASDPSNTTRVKRPEVPGYEILGELGRGGMGVVYQARQVRLNRMVALKMILAGEHANPDALSRLLAEAETIARVKHPNIVQIHAIGECGGWPYIELEFVEGGSLGAQLDGTPWSPRAAARLLERLARAVSEAHRLGIVHRDLKPANILMTATGEPKISDFGLAKSIEGDSGLTRTESILGSPSYMAPEQAAGRAKDVGAAADIYALGVTLYELITGRTPFIGPTVLATLDLVKNKDPVRPRKYQPRLPIDLETICLKCLEKEPQSRYESAEALANDLEAFLNDEPIQVRRPLIWQRAFRWVRRRPAAAALVLVCMLAIFTATGLWASYRADLGRRADLERRRNMALRTESNFFLQKGRESIRQKDWETARTQLSSAYALVRTEVGMEEMRHSVEKLLGLSVRSITEEKRRKSSRAHFASFQQQYDAAVFYQSDYTGMDADANVRAARAAARGALAEFPPSADKKGRLDLDATHFTPLEMERITDGCYELTLLLAEAESQTLKGEDPAKQARVALEALDGVARFRTPSSAYYLRRAACLERLGDRAGAEAQRKQAETATASTGSPVDDFLTGQQAYRQNNLKTATAALQRTLSRQPDNFWAQYLLAVCHLRAHRPAEAQAALIACQSRRPRFVWSYLLKAFAEGEMGEFDLAEIDFRRATELGLNEQERYVMLVNRGVTRIRRGDTKNAIDDLSAAIALKPSQFQAYVSLAQAHQNLKQWDQAVATLDKAIAVAPGQSVLYRARSQAHQLMQQPQAALRDLDSAIERSQSDDPNRVGDHVERALILQREGRSQEALAACNRAIELEPNRSDAHRVRGIILVGLKQYDEAIRSFDVCLARGKAPQAIYEARGLARVWGGWYDRAIADYTMALSVGPGSPSLFANRGWAYLLSGAPALAQRDFDNALRLEASNSHAFSAVSYTHLTLPTICSV